MDVDWMQLLSGFHAYFYMSPQIRFNRCLIGTKSTLMQHGGYLLLDNVNDRSMIAQ